MKRIVIVSLFVLFLAGLAAAQDGPLLLQRPTLSRTQIAFAFAGDLWIVSRDGGAATRLTNGVGMIRLTFSAQFPPLRTGRHRVAFRNRHLPEASVYLANALRPSDPLVGVERQERDVLQRELTITVSIKAPAKVRRPPAAG